MRRTSRKIKKNPYIIEGIEINKYLLNKYLNKESEKKLKVINDLSQLSTKTDNELLKVLEQMIKSKNYFKYCSSLLININPGPNYIYDYLNLKKWISDSTSLLTLNSPEKKPHLYSFMEYVYETMIKENKDQVVNLLGSIGTGKTFNLIHIIEYFTTMYGAKGYQTELFEMFHNSIQLIHIFGSIYRENNIESTSCGLLIKLGFNQNNIISYFGIESQILDLSLPFSENGRSFSIFHAFIKGANEEIKKGCKLPQSDEYLSFFSKFLSNFPEKVREKMTFNDLEIWNRFYSLSKYFKFSNDEINDILQILALILNLNELTISKIQNDDNNKKKDDDKDKENRTDTKEFYEIQKGKTFNKICKNLNIKLEEFSNCLGKFKSLQDAKTFIISFMKQTYYIIFDFILIKIRDYVNLYFNRLNKKIGTNNFKKNKNIYFIDFPGEVSDKTLGGFSTNIANECLNMYAASGFYEISEKLIKEKIYLNKFYPIKSYFAVSTCMEKGGLLEHFTKQFNRQNLNSLINNCLSKKNFMNCIKFKEKKSFEENDSNFIYQFSHKKIEYNYEALLLESKSLLSNEIITKIFSLTQNFVINSTFKNSLINKSKDFYSFFSGILCKIFQPIQNIKPFIVFCFHSNNSYKIFFKDKENKDNNENKDDKKIEKSNKKNIKNNNLNISFKEEEIPKDITLNMIKNSFIFPVLFWNWYGFKEWILIDEFIQQFSIDFEKVKNRIIQINNLDPDRKKFESNIILEFNQLPKEEVAKCTLSILSREGDYIIGKEYILMKQGTLERMRLYLNGMIDTAKDMGQKLKEKINKMKEKENKKIIKGRKTTVFIPLKLEEKMKKKIDKKKKESIIKNINIKLDFENEPLPDKKEFKPLEYDNNSRRRLLKEQCLLNIVSNEKIINDEEKYKIMKSKSFNLYYLISHRDKVLAGLESDIKDDIDLDELQINNNKKEKEKEREKENISTTTINDSSIIKPKKPFSKSKSKSSRLNEYSKHINSIIKIQSYIRRMISKNKNIILKYIYSEIIFIQKFIRGHITRVKFKKFLDCLKKIKLIQRLYKRRHFLKVRSVTKIQDFWKKRLEAKKYKEKIIAKKRAEAKGEYYNLDIESFAEFNQSNYNLESNLRKIELQNNKQNLTKKLIKETNPKKIVQLLLYGNGGKNKLTRAEKYGFDLKIEDKLIKQGEIMKKRKQDLSDKYKKKFAESNPYVPSVLKNNNNIIANKYPGEFLKRMEFYQLFKQKNLEELQEKHNRIMEDKKNDESDKIIQTKKINYDSYMKNAFDRLHNEQIQIEQRKRRKSQIENINFYLNNDFFTNINQNEEKINKKYKKRMTLKELLISDKMKAIYKNSSMGDLNSKNEIWPKKMKNSYLSRLNESKKSDKYNYSSESKSESESVESSLGEEKEEEEDDFFN